MLFVEFSINNYFFNNIFLFPNQDSSKIYTTHISYLEIYNECGYDLLDPRQWKKEKKPVLCSDREKGFYGPGHNSFTTDEAGRDVLVYHARNYTEIEGDPLWDPNRHTRLKYFA